MLEDKNRLGDRNQPLQLPMSTQRKNNNEPSEGGGLTPKVDNKK